MDMDWADVFVHHWWVGFPFPPTQDMNGKCLWKHSHHAHANGGLWELAVILAIFFTGSWLNFLARIHMPSLWRFGILELGACEESEMSDPLQAVTSVTPTGKPKRKTEAQNQYPHPHRNCTWLSEAPLIMAYLLVAEAMISFYLIHCHKCIQMFTI